MSLARANGEKCHVARSPQDELTELEREFLRAFPTKRKWWAIIVFREKHEWSWRAIAQIVSLSAGHCCRLYPRAKASVTVVAQKIATSVAPYRVFRDDQDDE